MKKVCFKFNTTYFGLQCYGGNKTLKKEYRWFKDLYIAANDQWFPVALKWFLSQHHSWK